MCSSVQFKSMENNVLRTFGYVEHTKYLIWYQCNTLIDNRDTQLEPLSQRSIGTSLAKRSNLC